MRGRRHQVATLAVVAALLFCGTALAGSGATGSPAGIKLAKRIVAALAKVPVESFVRRNYVWMAAAEGRVSSFNWTWGEGPTRGDQPAVEHIVLRTHDGRVVWWTDSLTPPACTSGGICSNIPVVVVDDAHGLRYAFGSAAKHTCAAALHGGTPFELGRVFWAAAGHFDAPVHAGADVRLTSSYTWAIQGAAPVPTATETDTVAAKSHLLLREHVSVNTGVPFGWSATFAYPGARSEPAFTPCA
ncbi:MAG TPA: hypothetical protein VID68_14465 [Solirubrobacteraceae bacterium]|jgi:hypothetical protein